MKLSRSFLALGLGIALVVPAAWSLADAPTNRGGYAPDPPGIASKKHWTFEVQVRQGKPAISKVQEVALTNPTTTARVIGRFALEFWIGKELLDRVRFDVPLLEDPSKKRDRRLGAPQFAVNTRLSVRMADSARATSVALVDRATGETHYFVWPPGSDGRLTPIAPAPMAADAGSDAPVSDAASSADAR
jgi:hypothetical protein